MTRDTNIHEHLFEVWQQPVYFEKGHKPIPGYKAIAGTPNGIQKVFSIVSNSYQLVTNQQALDLGKQIHRRLFPDARDSSFEVFNIIAPTSKSFCNIDIIDKNYTLNIWKQEVYVPFVRIHNSYNRTRSLQFDIGFCRKLCDNGMIFEENAVTLKFAHTKNAINHKDFDKVNVQHLRRLERDFVSKTRMSTQVELPQKFFVPLAAKVLKKGFNIQQQDPLRRMLAKMKMEQFKATVIDYSHHYIEKEAMGETAYAFYNVITHYASNNEQIHASAINGLQARCGMWINQIGGLVNTPRPNWENEIEGFGYLM